MLSWARWAGLAERRLAQLHSHVLCAWRSEATEGAVWDLWGAGWGVTDLAVCRDMAELRPESRVPAQFLLGNSEDLPLAPLSPVLWHWLGYIRDSGAFSLGMSPDCCQTVSQRPPGLLSSARQREPCSRHEHQPRGSGGAHPPSSWPPSEGRDWEAGVGVSVGTGPGTVLEPAKSGPEWAWQALWESVQALAWSAGLVPPGPIQPSLHSCLLQPRSDGRHLAPEQSPIRSRSRHGSTLLEATRSFQRNSGDGKTQVQITPLPLRADMTSREAACCSEPQP